jgi:hypothetical protein
MPKLKATETGLDNLEELEEAEYQESTFSRYDGEIPPKDTILVAQIKKMWYTFSKNDDPMLVVLVEADENVGAKAEYNGLGIWERMVLTAPVKFRWQPFLDVIGVTIRDVKNKTVVADEDDSQGAPIEKIGDFEVGSDAAWVRVLTAREKYDGKLQAKVGQWLEYEEPAPTDEETDAQADEPEAEVEPEPEEEKPASRARGGRKPAADEKPVTTARTGRTSRTAASTTRTTKAAAPSGRGRGARATAAVGTTDDIPF